MNRYLPEGSLISTEENYSYIKNKEGLERALNDQAILEAPAVLCDHDLNLHVELGEIKGIIPKNEVMYSKADEIKDIAILTRVGKTVSFKVNGFERNARGEITAILSRRAAQKECLDIHIKDLLPGDIIPAKVTHLESFGAFVDIGCGIISLLPIDSISVSRISNPQERFSLREKINVIVKSIDYENSRIYVSTRELFGTWEENAALFSPGQTVPGVVRSIEDYGIFVELAPNLAGLAEYHEDLTVGQCCAVYIKSIIPEKMKVKLVIIDTYDFAPDLKHPTYFIDTNSIKHMDYWRYSPDSCKKLVETIF
jgi:small subunit ribosomal protein S1